MRANSVYAGGKEETMDEVTFRVISGIAAAVVITIIIWRRRRQQAE